MQDTLGEILNLKTINADDINKLFDDYKISEIDSEIERKEAIERNSEIIICDRCGVSGNRPNMMRWHFENCKTIFRNCEYCKNIIPRQGIKNILYDRKKYCNRKCYTESKKGKIPIIMTDEVKNKLSKKQIEKSKLLSDRIKKIKPWEYRWNKN